MVRKIVNKLFLIKSNKEDTNCGGKFYMLQNKEGQSLHFEKNRR